MRDEWQDCNYILSLNTFQTGELTFPSMKESFRVVFKQYTNSNILTTNVKVEMIMILLYQLIIVDHGSILHHFRHDFYRHPAVTMILIHLHHNYDNHSFFSKCHPPEAALP